MNKIQNWCYVIGKEYYWVQICFMILWRKHLILQIKLIWFGSLVTYLLMRWSISSLLMYSATLWEMYRNPGLISDSTMGQVWPLVHVCHRPPPVLPDVAIKHWTSVLYKTVFVSYCSCNKLPQSIQICYSSKGQKSQMGLTGLKSRSGRPVFLSGSSKTEPIFLPHSGS